MNPLSALCRDSLLPAAIAGAAVLGSIAIAGKRDSGSALAPINASSHVLWGDQAARVERATLRHTVPGVAINLGAAFWWALVCRVLFGRAANRHPGTAVAAGTGTVALAYLLDYKLLPKRLTPGWELRISNRSLFTTLAVMGVGLGVGAVLAKQLDEHH